MRPALLLVSVAIAASVLTGCGGSSGAQPAAPDAVAADETPVRAPAPSTAGTSLDGEPISLADFRGRPVLVNVWSSW